MAVVGNSQARLPSCPSNKPRWAGARCRASETDGRPVTIEELAAHNRDVYEVVLFPEAYDRYGGLVFETRTMRVTGRVEPDGQINGEKLEALRK